MGLAGQTKHTCTCTCGVFGELFHLFSRFCIIFEEEPAFISGAEVL